MKAIELFAGVGGFRLGLERNGHKVVWANEWDKHAANTYDKNFEGGINRESITDVRAKDIPNHDLICGGFPCQAFSVAGKRKGFDETRGTLFFEIMRIAQHHRTPYLFLENVKGLLSHDGGRTFETIIRSLDELGYDCQWQVLNSKNFGVPQNRERVFIIGHLRGQPRPEVFPIGASTVVRDETRREPEPTIAHTLTSGGGGDDANGTYIIDSKPSSTRRGYIKEGYTGALETSGTQLVQRTPLRFLERNQKNIEGDYAFTVDTSNTGGLKVDNRIRRLTPLECERLQGFPDGWTEGVSDTQRYKMMGNAVTVNVIEAIAKRLDSAMHRRIID